ncbi:MAG: TIGR00282 family metallophosphoesterase [Nitrospirae bacterium]|nr:TIGR00282 family metallophosphoesterase [Nitrospirota bacterium]
MKILFMGDIVGKTGRDAIKKLLPNLVSMYKIDIVIANGENAAGGFGITESIAEELFGLGIHVITTGNHVWDKKEAVSYLSKENRVLRPLNYPKGAPGYGSVVIETASGKKIAVMNVSGRVFMNLFECPFRTAKAEAENLKKETDTIFVDFHAEATSEKVAFGYYMDGLVSAIVGTHTHVQTADEKILPGGTAYITDVGMTGPHTSVIGIEKEQIIEKFLYHMPMKYEVAGGKGLLCAVVVETDDKTGKATAIQRLMLTN